MTDLGPKLPSTFHARNFTQMKLIFIIEYLQIFGFVIKLFKELQIVRICFFFHLSKIIVLN